MKRIILLLLLVLASVGSYGQSKEELQSSYNYRRGCDLMSQPVPDNDGALEAFRKEVDDHPKNGYAYYYMALIHARKDRNGAALDCATKAISLLKKDKGWISYAYRLRAEVYLDLKQDGKALADWGASLKANHDDILTLNARAGYYMRKMRFDLAEADYQRLVKVIPGQTVGYNGMGLVALEQKQYDKAIEQFNYAVSLAPGESYAYAHRAEAYIGLKKYSEAADDIISAINNGERDNYVLNLIEDHFKSDGKDVLLAKFRIQQAKEKNNDLWSMMEGLVYQNCKAYRKAIDAYLRSFNIDGSDAKLYQVSECYSEMGDYSDAIDYIDRAMAIAPTDVNYIAQKADYLYYSGKPKEAIAELDEYVGKRPEFYGGYYRRGFYKDNAGDVDGAIEDYTTCIVQNPDYAYAYLGRGDQYMKKGDRDAAMADYRKVVEIDTAYVKGCCAFYAYAALGEPEKAVAFMDSALVHVKGDGIYYDAACLYSRMGRLDEAMNYLRTAMEKGYHEFAHLRLDDDMDPLRDRADFKALIAEYEAKLQQEAGDSADSATAGQNQYSGRMSEIPFTREAGGMLKVKCNINGLPLTFWLDTGASTVSMSMVEATFMMKNDYLSKDDVVGSSYFTDASGNVSEGTVINLRSVRFGDAELSNVKASVTRNLKAPLLLGQSVLARLGSVEIDYPHQLIRIKYFK